MVLWSIGDEMVLGRLGKVDRSLEEREEMAARIRGVVVRRTIAKEGVEGEEEAQG